MILMEPAGNCPRRDIQWHLPSHPRICPVGPEWAWKIGLVLEDSGTGVGDCIGAIAEAGATPIFEVPVAPASPSKLRGAVERDKPDHSVRRTFPGVETGRGMDRRCAAGRRNAIRSGGSSGGRTRGDDFGAARGRQVNFSACRSSRPSTKHWTGSATLLESRRSPPPSSRARSRACCAPKGGMRRHQHRLSSRRGAATREPGAANRIDGGRHSW